METLLVLPVGARNCGLLRHALGVNPEDVKRFHDWAATRVPTRVLNPARTHMRVIVRQDFVKCGMAHTCSWYVRPCSAVSMMRKFHRIETWNVQPSETIMQKTALTIFGALLISGLAVQMATASEHHARFRRAYNQWNGPADVAPVTRYNWDTNGFGFSGRDPSRVGGEDPALRPSGS